MWTKYRTGVGSNAHYTLRWHIEWKRLRRRLIRTLQTVCMQWRGRERELLGRALLVVCYMHTTISVRMTQEQLKYWAVCIDDTDAPNARLQAWELKSNLIKCETLRGWLFLVWHLLHAATLSRCCFHMQVKLVLIISRRCLVIIQSECGTNIDCAIFR